jgi:phosphoribosylformimino-5-aminoimidazole carboxamide ribotide isomerase
VQLFPAVDIQGGKAVRLRGGDFSRSTVFADDPVAAAKTWEQAGASAVHVVDLDAARSGALVNFTAVRTIAGELSIPVQYGGGVRDEDTLERVMHSGLRWIVLGTAAITNESLLEAAVEKLGDRLTVGVDCVDGMVATHGWRQRSQVSASTFVSYLEERGVSRIVFTDIATDGMMHGPNLPALLALAERTRLEVVQSGGISTLEDLCRLRSVAPANVVGVIVGRALYEGAFTVAQAVDVLA